MKKYIPFVILILGLLIALSLGWQDHFTLDSLRSHREVLKHFVEEHWILAPLLYILAYFCLTGFAVPADAFMCLTAGFLFPQPLSTIYILCASLSGGVLLFWAARTAFGDFLKRRAGPRMQKIEANIQRNAFSYLVFLRLIPIFPTWLVNLTPALCEVPFPTFFWSSFIGIIPGAYVFSQAGRGLGAFLDHSTPLPLSSLFDRSFYIGLSVMLLLAMSLIVFKVIKNKITK